MMGISTRGHGGGGAVVFDRSIRGFFWDALWAGRGDKHQLASFARMAAQQRKAMARRRWWETQGVHVPPLMITSVTRTCNLRCAGCFVHAQGKPAGAQMSDAELERIFGEARDLGVSMIALAGGEPLTRPEILDIAGGFPEIQFLLITNGSLVSGEVLDKLERLRNVIPIVSLEGLAAETDGRRGAGVYEQAVYAMERMQERRFFFGASLMITRRNFALVTSRMFVRDLVKRGSRLFFYVDYVPVQPGTEHLVPSDCQRNTEALTMDLLRREFHALFLASSAMEQRYGGCMAAGKAFVHVSADGDLEPCPFSPVADTNLREMSLREALGSRLLRQIRDSDERLAEGQGGCALWADREWVWSLLTASPMVVDAAPGLAPSSKAA